MPPWLQQEQQAVSPGALGGLIGWHTALGVPRSGFPGESMASATSRGGSASKHCWLTERCTAPLQLIIATHLAVAAACWARLVPQSPAAAQAVQRQ